MERLPLEKLKKKSAIAIVVFFFVLLSMGMATYSWYIVSTAPTVRAVETYMSVVDSIMSIARATDDQTPPPEVGNDDASIGDSTWGVKVTSFQDNSVIVEYPATMKNGQMESATHAEDYRLDQLKPLIPGEMGTDTEGHRLAGVRYYTNDNGQICAAGLGVWLRINKENKDLVLNALKVTVKDASGTEVIGPDKVGIALRSSADGIIKRLKYNDEVRYHSTTIYDHTAGHPFPVNTPVFVELIVFMEGDTETEGGLIAADVARTLYVNIESVTFYDNISFDVNYGK